MSDLDNLQALKRMLEHKDEEEAKESLEKEKRFLAAATDAYLGGHVTGIQGYKPDEMIAFLSLPSKEIQTKMGGEWAEMEDMAFDAFVYPMRQKIQKSTTMIDWNS